MIGDTRISLGIDIGGTAVKAALLVGDAAPRTARSDLYEHPTLDELTRHVRHALARVTNAEPPPMPGRSAAPPWVVPPERITAAALALPGPLDDDRTLAAAANLRCLVGVNLRAWLRETLSLAGPVHLMTDTLAAARGDHARQPLPGRALYLTLGTGVGGAILDDGEPLLITRGTPGHFGHIDVSGGDPDAPATPGAGRGALEAYIGFRALQRAGVPTSDPGWTRHAAAQPALRALARALRILLVLYRPRWLILLGGVGVELRPALALLHELVSDGLSPAAPAEWELRVGTGGPFAAALGVAAAVHFPA